MKYFVLLSFLLALVAGHSMVAPDTDREPDLTAATAEFEGLPTADAGSRSITEHDDAPAADPIERSFPRTRTPLAACISIQWQCQTNAPYAIRAPPLPNAA